jgi:hypothetical protein
MVQQVCGDISAFGSQYGAEGTGPDVCSMAVSLDSPAILPSTLLTRGWAGI